MTEALNRIKEADRRVKRVPVAAEMMRPLGFELGFHFAMAALKVNGDDPAKAAAWLLSNSAAVAAVRVSLYPLACLVDQADLRLLCVVNA